MCFKDINFASIFILSVRVYHCCHSVIFVVFLLDFKTVPTVCYFLVFLLHFRTDSTVWYFLFFISFPETNNEENKVKRNNDFYFE
jgi:hypothetical protein